MDSSRNKDQQQYIETTPHRFHYPKIVCFIIRVGILILDITLLEDLWAKVHLKPCKSIDQLVDDIFTKSLAQDVFEFHRRNLGIVGVAET